MVTTRLVGRAGNSFYQVAACIAYAKKFNYQNWGIPFVPTGEEGMKSAIHDIFPNLPKTGDRPRSYPRDGYEPQYYDYFEMQNQGPDVLLQGFWQSYKWFAHCEDEVRKWFHMERIPGYEDYVSIHVRRGDYVQNAGSFPPINDKYLLFATDEADRIPHSINHIGERKYLVFSDDIPWCREYFKKYGSCIEFSEGKTVREDLQLMRSCGHHIISNSSLAWWGAYLGHNPNRIIICPHHTEWYGPENGIVQHARSMGVEPCRDLIPDGWIQIKFR